MPRRFHQWFLLFFLLCATAAHAQWQSTTYTLKGGWNAIYLHGAATHATLDQLFPNTGATANVLEVWRWNPNSSQVQFITSPLIPMPGTAEWDVWVRGGTSNTLTQMTGQNAYLVRCKGTATGTATIAFGAVTGIAVTEGGSGYSAAPAVTIAPPTAGTTATATAVISGGVVTAINITGGGSGYTVAPVVTVAPPAVNPTYSVAIAQKMLPPSATWVRNGANFLGFPTFKNGATYPTFSNYFATYPVAIAANTRIYKYIGGDLGAGNPLQIFSPIGEPLDRNTAYWFSAEVVGNFYAPIEITLSTAQGLDFGRTGSTITARVLNRSNAVLTLRVAPVNSDPAPSGQEAITAAVPLTRRTFNTMTGTWTETALATYDQPIGPLSTVELSFGIDRTAMSGAAGALHASMVRFTDLGGNLFDILKLARCGGRASSAGCAGGAAREDACSLKAIASHRRGRAVPHSGQTRCVGDAELVHRARRISSPRPSRSM